MCASASENPPTVVVASRNADDAADARQLAQALRLEVAGGDWRESIEFALLVDGDRLSLADRDSKDDRGMTATFPALPVRHGRISISRNEPLGRAFGPRVQSIVDATAGLGQDSFLLAAMGFDVTAIERCAIVAALLRNGIERALRDGRIRQAIDERLHAITGDARDVLAAMAEKPDAVYLDPMFPPKRKESALARKSVRIIRALVGDDPDAGELLRIAIQNARERVVVKRADDAPPLMPNPVASIRGTTVRYDVYRASSEPSSLTLESRA